jgi:hypothetical protein
MADAAARPATPPATDPQASTGAAAEGGGAPEGAEGRGVWDSVKGFLRNLFSR